MLRILNFIMDEKTNIFTKLIYHFFPKIIKRIIIDVLEIDIIIYDTYICKNLKKNEEKVIKKLIRELIKDESYKFICENGKYDDILTAYGFKTSNLKEYLIKKVSTAVEILIKASQLSPDKVNIAVVDNEFNRYTLRIIKELIYFSKNISLITSCIENYIDEINDIYNEFGSAIIITDSYEPINRANIILVLNGEDLFFEFVRNENVVIICLDEKIKENEKIKNKLITSYSFALSKELIEIIPNNILKSKVASAIYFEDFNNKKYEKINEFYSFNKQVFIKEIKDKLKMLDRM